MTSRNSLILLLASMLSLACYHRASRNRYASAVAEAMGEIDANFVESVNQRDLFEGSLRGMTRSLDDYSGYVSPKQYEKLKEDIDQEFGGVGVIVDVDKKSDHLLVVTPILDTPAQKAGVRAGDLIMAVEYTDEKSGKERWQSTKGMTSADTVGLIRGTPGSSVRMKIKSPDETDEKVVEVERAIIPVQSVLGDRRRSDGSWDFFLEEESDIGYIRLVTFGEHSASDLTSAIEKIQPQAKGLIFDLRGNGGGLLAAAVDICNLFIDEGVIVSVKGRQKSDQREYKADASLVLPMDFPVVVLVDHFSASASEITSACLQDHERATVIGERTWGKGTVQSLLDLEGGRSALRLTTATYWRPSGKNIHRLAKTKPEDDWGVTPDPEFTIDYEDEERLDVMRARVKRDALLLGEDGLPLKKESGDEGDADADDADSASDSSEDKKDEKDEDGKPKEPVVDLQLNKAIEHMRSLIDGPAAVEVEDVKKAA